jgi:KaiC/GvpD/RAD55 family RecA-like ATPase
LNEFSLDLQKLFLEIMIHDAQLFVRVQSIYNAENFDRGLQQVAKYIQEYSDEYRSLPTATQIRATTNIELNEIPDAITDSYQDWFLTEFESFSRRKELERAILVCADMIQDGQYGQVEKIIKDAVQVSLVRDIGTDYFADPRARLLALKNNNGQISTGWSSLDQYLYGGFNRGELEIFAAQSGGGKSLVKQNLSVNWFTTGLNGAYITLELSEELCAMRIDSMLTNVNSREIFRDLDNVEMKIRIASKKSGDFYLKYFPAQSSVNQIRSYVKELQIRTNKKLDFLAVDYLDLVMPSTVKVNPSDFFTKDKFVAEELRNLAKELNIVVLTSSQLNRSSQEEIEFNHGHISGGISKINTCDNFIAIYTSRAMKERGKYQFQLLKTRNSAGVGNKLDLDFMQDTLKITDPGPQASQAPSQADQILSQVRNRPQQSHNVAPAEPQSDVSASGTSDAMKIRQMLANLRANPLGTTK